MESLEPELCELLRCHPQTWLAQQFGCGRATVYRMLRGNPVSYRFVEQA